MTRVIGALLIAVVSLVGLASQAQAQLPACPQDSVRSGPACMDKWEASVWYVPPTPALAQMVNWIKTGNVAGLKGPAGLAAVKSAAAGVVQVGLAAGDVASHGCPETGNGCKSVYAVSIPGVTPAAFINWFQAAAAARNSLKRLPSNQEWQVAALGTPDGTLCNVDEFTLRATNTGSLPGCVSDVGAFDMVGNLYEWVAEWVPRSTTCVPSLFAGTDDQNCMAGASTESGPGALIRGGGLYDNGPLAGVFAVDGSVRPSVADGQIGFRAVR